MTNLSEILAEIEASAAKVKELENDLTTERDNGKKLVEQYRAQSGEARKLLGIDAPRKERKPRSNAAVLVSAANRAIRHAVKTGEKNAKKKLNLAEVPADVKQQIEERVKSLGKKSPMATLCFLTAVWFFWTAIKQLSQTTRW